jgi:hypothetical protein
MIDELWSMAQRSRSLQSFRADVHGIWSDSAAADINNLYLDPHQDSDDEMRRALDEQKHSLDQAQESCNAAQEYGIEAVKLSQRVEKSLEEIEKDLKIVYEQIELFGRSANDARAKFATVKELIARANGACGGQLENGVEDPDENEGKTGASHEEVQSSTQADGSQKPLELPRVVLPALVEGSHSSQNQASTNSTLKINFKHIFHGEIREGKRDGKRRAKGFHYRGSIGHEDKARIVLGTKTPPNMYGVVKAKVEIFDKDTNDWKKKWSTFFPDHWSRQQVIDEIRGAYARHTKPRVKEPRYWEGNGPSGIRIGGYLDASGEFDIDTAFPLYLRPDWLLDATLH